MTADEREDSWCCSFVIWQILVCKKLLTYYVIMTVSEESTSVMPYLGVLLFFDVFFVVYVLWEYK